jgi:branched-chain amino acid transport system substrate-binding protein
VLKEKGYKVVDPGRYQNMTADFSSYISAFKAANVEIVAGVPTPPDFKTFWTQAKQQGFRPKIVTVGKALAFPSAIEAVGNIGEGVSQESFWSANRPFKSSMTGQSAAEIAAAYEKAMGKQWSQPLGCSYAMFEVALDVLRRTRNIDKKESIRDALAASEVQTVAGPLSWRKGPVKNVAKTPLVGAQWAKGKGTNPYELLIVNNETMPSVPVQGKFKSL